MPAPALAFSANVLPRSISVPPQQGDILLTRVSAFNGQTEQIMLRPQAGSSFSFGGNGELVVSAGNIQNVTPTTGQTVVCTADAVDRTLNLTPAGTLATLTVTLPANATSRIGQVQRIVSSQILTALTINGATTIRGNVTTFAATGGYVAFQKVSDNTWARVA